MSLDLTIYPIQFPNLFIPNSIIYVFNRLSFQTNTIFLKTLKQSEILQTLPPGIKIEYENGEETYITRDSLRIGEPLMMSYSNRLKPWLLNYLQSEKLNDWDYSVVQFLLALPDSNPVIFNWK